MNLTVTIAPESLASIKAAVVSELQQPSLAPVGLCKQDHDEVAKSIIDNHGDSLVNSIVDNRHGTLTRGIAEQIDLSDLASEFSVRDIGEHINIDASDVAENIDMSELAQHLDIDTDDMADRVANNLDLSDIAHHVADEVDYETLAEALNTKSLAREIVGQFINNEEFRKSFMETLLLNISQSITK